MAVDVVLQRIKLKNHSPELLVSPGRLFLPNATSRLFSKVVEIRADDVVFDIGTGTGVLAIWAALEGCKAVHAVDPVKDHCQLASENARRHNVLDKLTVYNGSLFDPLPKSLKADVIIGDVSGIADGPGKALGWYTSNVPSGGGDGTDVIIGLLDKARNFLTPRGRLFFPVAVGLSDSDKIMDAARHCFDSLECKVDVWFPLSDEEYERVAGCLPERLLAKITRRGSRLAWKGQIYEASMPRRLLFHRQPARRNAEVLQSQS